MEWKTMSTSDLINLANQLSHTLDESLEKKNTRFPNLQIQQMKAPKQNLLVSAILNIQDTGEETVTNLSILVASNQSFQYTPNSPREF